MVHGLSSSVTAFFSCCNPDLAAGALYTMLWATSSALLFTSTAVMMVAAFRVMHIFTRELESLTLCLPSNDAQTGGLIEVEHTDPDQGQSSDPVTKAKQRWFATENCLNKLVGRYQTTLNLGFATITIFFLVALLRLIKNVSISTVFGFSWFSFVAFMAV